MARQKGAWIFVLVAWYFATPAANAKPEKEKRYAVIVGVNGYYSGKFPKLRFAENDAEGLAQVLSGRYGFSNIEVLTNSRGEKDEKQKPTVKNIKGALERVMKGKGRNDMI